MMMSTFDVEHLAAFIEEVRPLLIEATMEERLAIFISDMRKVLKEVQSTSPPLYSIQNINIDSLRCFLSSLPDPLEAAKRGGFLCDPWEIASLSHNELRNSKVLAWLLSPLGSHGFCGAILDKLLAEINNRLQDFNFNSSSNAIVRTEICPDGDQGNRVDIEIDAPNFYLIIEVKIFAPEGEKQIERYARIASARARKRPWAVVYLTPKGRLPMNPTGPYKRVVALSWGMIASQISDVLRSRRSLIVDTSEMVTSLLALKFVTHIRKF